AMPGPRAAAAPGDGGAARAEARFDPPATLVQQLGAPRECQTGGEAQACAARPATALLARIVALAPPPDLAPAKDSLLAALAALEEVRVPVGTEARWRVLREGTDPGARLAQALTLVVVTQHLAHCAHAGCPGEQTARLAGLLADELALG